MYNANTAGRFGLLAEPVPGYISEPAHYLKALRFEDDCHQWWSLSRVVGLEDCCAAPDDFQVSRLTPPRGGWPSWSARVLTDLLERFRAARFPLALAQFELVGAGCYVDGLAAGLRDHGAVVLVDRLRHSRELLESARYADQLEAAS